MSSDSTEEDAVDIWDKLVAFVRHAANPRADVGALMLRAQALLEEIDE